MFSALNAGRQRCAVAHGDGNASVMELEAADESGDDSLVLKQGELHADTDPRALRESEETAPTAAHLVRGGEPALAWGAVPGLGSVAPADEPTRGTEGVGVAKDVLVAVNTDRRDVDDLPLLDGDRLDPRAVSAADGVAEGNDVVVFCDLLVAS